MHIGGKFFVIATKHMPFFNRPIMFLTIVSVLMGCATIKKPSRKPDSEVGRNGEVGQVGSQGLAGQAGGIGNREFWYAHTQLRSHYHFAIPDDLAKMREWIGAGFSADTKASPTHPSAIQQAISYRAVPVVQMLVENPRVESRPNPRLKIVICPRDLNYEVNLYEYIGYLRLIEDFERSCLRENLTNIRRSRGGNLYIDEEMFEMFSLVAAIDNDLEAFQRETANLLVDLRASEYTREPDSINDRMLKLIEKKGAR